MQKEQNWCAGKFFVVAMDEALDNMAEARRRQQPTSDAKTQKTSRGARDESRLCFLTSFERGSHACSGR